jgi:hypothetical protein
MEFTWDSEDRREFCVAGALAGSPKLEWYREKGFFVECFGGQSMSSMSG